MTTTQLQPTHFLDIASLKKFAQNARRQLIENVRTKMDQVLSMESAELREKEAAIKELKAQIAQITKEGVIERVAYTWFNRFCAMRFMDVNGYTKVRTVSPSEGFTQPEILSEAKQGLIDDCIQSAQAQQRILDLLRGTVPSSDPQQEAYRTLLVGACNHYHKIMPFMFEKIADYTELLMPDDLLSDGSVLAQMRLALTPETCTDVEVIGWLYQFYISEKKDEVFEGLKKNEKITPENIPAATQLFTPQWIVAYLVENSLGRLWMLNRPASRLVERMSYYIPPEQEATEFLRISKPEELRICDPACGSGHMLVYAFDLLYAIYEEEGYESTEIPRLILENNLYGIEIDKRAGQLAAFGLVMKARAKHRRFFSQSIQPNICVLENLEFSEDELQGYCDQKDLATQAQRCTAFFAHASNFGSLIPPISLDTAALSRRPAATDLFSHKTQERLAVLTKYLQYLNNKYDVVIANPPYMGSKGMNPELREFAAREYNNTKADLFSMFIDRCLQLVKPRGYVSMVTMHSWMFLSTFEDFRTGLLGRTTIVSMAHLGRMAFDTLNSKVVATTAFVLLAESNPNYQGSYLRVTDGNCELDKQRLLKNHLPSPFFASALDFMQIPSSPIAYWMSRKLMRLFPEAKTIEQITISDGQNKTGNNDKYLRYFWEISSEEIGTGKRWIPYAKGGEWRKWFGNIDLVVDWSETARQHYRKDKIARLIPEYLWYRSGVTWSFVTTQDVSFRLLPEGGTFDVQGSSLFFKSDADILPTLALLNSSFANYLLKIFNPTMSLQVKDVRGVPLPSMHLENSAAIARRLVDISKQDWESLETSPGFAGCPLVPGDVRNLLLSETYSNVRTAWSGITREMQRLEEENNQRFIDAFELDGELTKVVPLSDVTLTRNPAYRYYGPSTSEIETQEQMLLTDTIKEFISYAVGCMFGRYSLDKPGLILSTPNGAIDDYSKMIPTPRFPIDEDNVIPILDGDWFTDDISEQFRKFLKATFGQQHYDENLSFIEKAIGKDIRKYFVKDFYTDHLKRYKKRPIYWLFSSPKGTFNALIYLHRYRPDTINVVLNDYLREFRNKLAAHRTHLESAAVSQITTAADKTKALKQIEALKKTIEELDNYERDILYPLAMQKIEIDLNDGVKSNYLRFGKALKAIPGINADEE